ncbi:cadherin-like domain-containing protein [Belnapia sp. T6]|uniref:Cadherin-like domain-containing protein n=1 Tax=Belnapia mucosa TaxID=2804532 RepID=A0ABS1V5J8_9PROT|nr:cadherin-like domain-containing protein [Belnapia mucosa]MBL6456962.1 cadherin-like domain-containing protein [Belnapia mucosa]
MCLRSSKQVASFINHESVTTRLFLFIFLDDESGPATEVEVGKWRAKMAYQRINGTSGNDKKVGTAANEAFYGGAGNDDFDGAGGTDTALYTDQSSDFTISTVNGVTMVKHRDNQETTWDGNDKLTNVERLEFSDKTIFLTTNKGPVAVADVATGKEDTGIVIQASTLLANDSDPDGDDLVITGVGGATHGSVVVSADKQTITYTPDANYFGAAEFSYTVSDAIKGASANDLLTATAKVGLTIAAVNDAPVGSATATLSAGTEDTAYIVSAADLLQGFSDLDGDKLSVSALAANHGAVADSGNGTYTITPTANYNGLVALSYNVIDGNGGVMAASQNFNLAAVNDAHTGGVSVSGTAKVGEVLTASNTLADVDGLGAITYEWFAGATKVGSGSTYTAVAADVGTAIHALATFTDGGGTLESESSAATAAVEALPIQSLIGKSFTVSLGVDHNNPLSASAGTKSGTIGDGVEVQDFWSNGVFDLDVFKFDITGDGKVAIDVGAQHSFFGDFGILMKFGAGSPNVAGAHIESETVSDPAFDTASVSYGSNYAYLDFSAGSSASFLAGQQILIDFDFA